MPAVPLVSLSCCGVGGSVFLYEVGACYFLEGLAIGVRVRLLMVECDGYGCVWFVCWIAEKPANMCRRVVGIVWHCCKKFAPISRRESCQALPQLLAYCSSVLVLFSCVSGASLIWPDCMALVSLCHVFPTAFRFDVFRLV